MSFNNSKKHPLWFREWQKKFYNSKEWKKVRDDVRRENKMRCKKCKKLIRGIAIVDHVIELNVDNYTDESITLNKDNTELLCLACHNRKTFGSNEIDKFDVDEKRNVNLF
ncbi:HNH endonuclease [Listeria innocua]|uniref:HNH endonuclease n=1 Tax=Listeria innocua TaxID=1642 RepID=UPI00162A162B|nr:HNH endonuclease [Listeria innocua]MBC1377858.1 HNH endonuclease [Listeria innocua]HAC4847866.1 HNH endonuclease [Listeria monocytogenes]